MKVGNFVAGTTETEEQNPPSGCVKKQSPLLASASLNLSFAFPAHEIPLSFKNGLLQDDEAECLFRQPGTIQCASSIRTSGRSGLGQSPTMARSIEDAVACHGVPALPVSASLPFQCLRGHVFCHRHLLSIVVVFVRCCCAQLPRMPRQLQQEENTHSSPEVGWFYVRMQCRTDSAKTTLHFATGHSYARRVCWSFGL